MAVNSFEHLGLVLLLLTIPAKLLFYREPGLPRDRHEDVARQNFG